MKDHLRPNKAEQEFLKLAYNRFYDVYEEVMADSFWRKNKRYRFSIIKDCFLIYTELLNYKPLKWEIEYLKKARPPMEAEIGSELFKFVRNIITHFPFFNTWENVWISKQIINWNKDGQSIDKFLTKYSGKNPVKYRIWEEKKRKMTYLSIIFPKNYGSNTIYLNNILTEKEGVKFSFILMRKILDSQVEKID